MTKTDYEIIRVVLERSESGLFSATSPDMAGVCVSHRDINAIHDDFPNIIKIWFKNHRKIDVDVFNEPLPEAWAQSSDGFEWKTIALPAEVAAMALAR
jgi:hypothetical protein